MAQFFEYKIATTDDADKKVVDLQWCESDPVLAMSLETGSIQFYQTEAQIAATPISRTGKICRRVAWKPNAKVLSCGWDDGCITYWNTKECSPIDHTGIHRSPVCLLKWDPTGEFFLSADISGVIAVWKPQGRGKLPKPLSYTLEGRYARCCCFVPPISVNSGKDQIFLHTMFVGSTDRSLYLVDDARQCVFLKQFRNEIENVLFFDAKSRLIILTQDLSLSQFHYKADGTFEPISKIKLNIIGSKGILHSEWLAPGLLATVSGDYAVKVWDLVYESNYSLTTTSCVAKNAQTKRIIVGEKPLEGKEGSDRKESQGFTPSVSILKKDELYAFSFDPRRRVLAACGKQGSVYFWKFVMKESNSLSADRGLTQEQDWTPLDPIFNPDMNPDTGDITGFRKDCDSISWGAEGVFAVHFSQFSSIYRDTNLQQGMNEQMVVNQINSNAVLIEKIDTSGNPIIVKTSMRITGFGMDGATLLLFGDSQMKLYAINFDEGIPHEKGSVSLERIRTAGVRGDSIYVARDRAIEIYNFSGVKKGEILLSDAEGSPTHMSINGHFLAYATSQHLIRICDISRRDPKPLSSGGLFAVTTEGSVIYPVISKIAVNCKGDEVVVIANELHGKIQIPDPRVYVYTTSMDSFLTYSFNEPVYPVQVSWDPVEPYLLACLTQVKEGVSVDSSSAFMEAEDLNRSLSVFTLYTNEDYGIKMMDSFFLPKDTPCLMGISVPNIFIGKEYKGVPGSLIVKRIMRDFIGFSESELDKSTKRALLDFSYNLTIGNMDAAYNSVKSIRNVRVWENMAHMCIKTKRLDVAQVCLGQMGHARGSRALRMAMESCDESQGIAMLAIQLGHLEEAKEIYEESGRYDLLNVLFQCAGQWGRALEVAKTKDRLNMRPTYFNYARHLESIDNIKSAIDNYELANLQASEVPRMLFDKKQIADLMVYIQTHDSPDLKKWWGRYCESQGNVEEAMACYKQSKDIQSQVRLLCCQQNFRQAEDIVFESKDPAASYLLARTFESKGEMAKAIQHFKYAKKYGHAVMLAKEENLDNELMNLALMSPKKKMHEVAMYFEAKQDFEKAVTLYEHCDQVSRAMDLCFKNNLFEKLKEIVENVSDSSNPQLTAKCAEFFIRNGQYEKAIELYASSGNPEEALKMIERYNIKLTTSIVDRLTNSLTGEDQRKNDLLVKVADLLQSQGFFKMATKVYAKAGMKTMAMKCLLKTGDTEKIIFFANVSRSQEVYILAGNYLQTLDWKNDSKLINTIIQYYVKQEIDEFRNYKKADQALVKSLEYLTKDGAKAGEDTFDYITLKRQYVQRYLKALEMAQKDDTNFVQFTIALAQEPDIDNAVRVGDILSLLVDYSVSKKNYSDAHHYVEQMKKNGLNVTPYFTKETLHVIYQAVGQTFVEEDAAQAGDGDIPEDFN